MKRNTWVFYFFIILFTAILSMNLVWRFTPIRSEITNTIQQRLKSYLGESFAMSDFSLGFGYMAFYNITAGSKDGHYLFKLDEIQIGYSMHKLLFNKLDPLKVIESITFKNPTLILWTNGGDSTVHNNQRPLDLRDVFGGLNNLSEIDRILIKNGRIFWGKSPESATKLVSEMDGYILMNSENQIALNLRGKLFEASSRDLTLTGDIMPHDMTYNILANIENSHLKKSLPFLVNDNFTLDEADINGTIRINSSGLKLNDIQLSGKIMVKNMTGLLFGQELKTDTFDLVFDGQKMRFSPVSGNVQDGQFVLTGNLGTIFHPSLYFSIDFDEYSAKNLVISAPILELLNQGKIQGHFDVTGPVSRVKVTGKIYSSQLHYSIVPFYRTSLDFTYQDKIWEFQRIQATFIGMDHHGEGAIDFNSMTMVLDLTSTRNIGGDVFPIIDRLNNTAMNYFTRIVGDFPSLTFKGTINGEFRQGQNIVLSTDAAYELVKDQITVQNYQSFPSGMKIYSEVTDIWNNPTFRILELKDIPIDSLSTLNFLKGLNKKYRGDFYFSGPVNFPTSKISFSNRETQEVLFSFTGNASNLIQQNLKFRGHFLFETRPETIDGNLLIERKPENLALQLDIPSMMNGNLYIGYGEQASFEGNLNIAKFPIRQYIGRFSGLAGSIKEGNLLGTVSFNGTTDQPTIIFDVQAEDFIINNNGYYSAVVQGAYENFTFHTQNSAVNYNNRPIIRADIDWNTRSKFLKAAFQGDQIESNFIASTIFKDARLVQGAMNYQLTLEGNVDHPRIQGTATMQNGILKERNFNDLHVEFEDSIPPVASLFQIGKHFFHIRKLTYHDKRNYVVEISGVMPADPGSPMNLKLDAEGNILAELPSLISYFRNPVCLGEVELSFTGTRENPKIEAGKVNIYNGSLEFESVIPPLKELKADIELHKGEQFLRIRNLEGKINNRSVRIFNLDSVKVGEDYLDPWKFEDLGIDLGILVLETDKRGIPLSIPGLMNPGDIGYFATEGKEARERFYFSGPVEKPKVRGKVILHESRVTFPFLETSEGTSAAEENKVIDFLMNINWDLTAIAGTGNRYFVDIPALIGQAYLDLNIDNVSKGLDFTGRLSDESFRVSGSIESTRGRVEYLDMNFRVERFGAIFNTFELFPEVYGRAYTTVRDSTDFPRDIYLVLYAIDPETKQEVSRGRWEDFRFKLVSSDPTIGETQENVLSYLGYSVDNISSKASDIGMTLTDNLLIRPLVRPLERRMERGLGLDYVRLSLQITSNIFYYGLQPRWKFLPEANYGRLNYNTSFDPALLLLQSSEITLGKYLLKDIYFSYSGQLVSVYDEPKFGLNHRFGVEYRLLQNLLLEFEYDKFYFDPKYYSKDALHDFRIRLKHSFNF